jgi:hypothetical protein
MKKDMCNKYQKECYKLNNIQTLTATLCFKVLKKLSLIRLVWLANSGSLLTAIQLTCLIQNVYNYISASGNCL